MSISKKHFEAVAAAMHDIEAPLYVCEELARVFGWFNPAFDRARFLRACGW